MDTRELQLFLSLSETLHFGQTGEALHISASAVSRTIKRMELEVGHRLLERDNRSVRMTEVGRQFQAYASGALGQWQSFRESTALDSQYLRGQISLFCSVTAAYSVLSPVLEPFRHRYPDIDIKLRTGDQADAIDHLLTGQDDVAIVARPDKLPPRLNFEVLTHSPLLFIGPAMDCAVARKISPLLERGVAVPWGDIPFVVSERGLARTRLDQWFRSQGAKPDIYAQVSGHEAIVSMVGLGFGLGVVPELVLNNSPLKEKVRVLEVKPALTAFAVGVSASQQRLENPLVKAFWDCARASYRSDF